MSYYPSFGIFRYAPVFLQTTHPGRARCKHCGDRIRHSPRLGWHGRYYHIACWWDAGNGREFLSALLSCLSDEMLEQAGLRVEHEESAPQTSSYDLNDFGVRMLRTISGFNAGEIYPVRYFNSRAGDPVSEVASPDEIHGARIINPDGSSWYLTREGRFEVVLLDSAPEPESEQPIDDRVLAHTGEEASAGDLVRFVQMMHEIDSKASYLGQEFRVRMVQSSTSYPGRQLIALENASGMPFYDDELMLVSVGESSSEPESAELEEPSVWIPASDVPDISVGDTVRITFGAPTWGNLGPGSITTIARIGMGTLALNGQNRDDDRSTTWNYYARYLEVQR